MARTGGHGAHDADGVVELVDLRDLDGARIGVTEVADVEGRHDVNVTHGRGGVDDISVEVDPLAGRLSGTGGRRRLRALRGASGDGGLDVHGVSPDSWV
ncbi:hypothetical protein JQN58_32005 [Aneurinibacillus sp. BA2021]|nr:hypothetical protein [Aneurinibacillus sp. BA2021]